MSADPWKTPKIAVEILDDRTAGSRPDEGFLRVRRLSLRNRYEDGAVSAPYRYDIVERDATDAVVLVLYALGQGEPLVCLRTALRPPLDLRAGYALPLEDEASSVIWELPAGLIERDERGEAGLARCAAREGLEETGLVIDPAAFERLGPGVYLTPGVLAERVYFLAAAVDPATRGVPTEDGSPVEERASVIFVSLSNALAACADGRIADSKTELGLRRLAELLARGPR
jgi:8-oxo-dGTP pyrophosphatase MutT (NUDIX family)